MENKTIYWTISIIVILILVFAGYSYMSSYLSAKDKDSPKVEDNEADPSIIAEYPALAGEAFLNASSFAYMENKEKIANVSLGLLIYEQNNTSNSWQDSFSCSDKNISIKILKNVASSSIGTPMFIGTRTSVIECGNSYWIVFDTNIEWSVYGTFKKQ